MYAKRLIAGAMLALALSGSLIACAERNSETSELVQAVRDNDVDTLFKLLEEGADPNHVADGWPLIYVASGPKGGVGVAQMLLNAGADPNARSQKDNRLPLQNAASWCSIQIVSFLLEAGADPHLKGKNDKTALDDACRQPQREREIIVDMLRKAMSN